MDTSTLSGLMLSASSMSSHFAEMVRSVTAGSSSDDGSWVLVMVNPSTTDVYPSGTAASFVSYSNLCPSESFTGSPLNSCFQNMDASTSAVLYNTSFWYSSMVTDAGRSLSLLFSSSQNICTAASNDSEGSCSIKALNPSAVTSEWKS